ncbi:hypothetical protein CWI40_090580 [Ordospora colligata]|nr:hypothetical protein CWI40_090580 [Ordospora colligata]
MDALLNRKHQLQNKLDMLHAKKQSKIDQDAQVARNISQHKETLVQLNIDLIGIRTVLIEKRRLIEKLQSEIEIYKKEVIKNAEQKLKTQYIGIVDEMNKIRPSMTFSTFGEFAKLKILIDNNVFNRLEKRLNAKYIQEKEKLKAYILSQIDKRIDGKRVLHELVFYMRFLRKYDEYFEEDVIGDYMCSRLLSGFEYHFMSDRESNRLDRPEWFFDFIQQRAKEAKELFEMYENMSGESGSLDVHNGFKRFVSKAMELTEMKSKEVSECNSKQKRNLMLHFGREAIKFCSEMHKKYGIAVGTVSIGDALHKEQTIYFSKRISAIHEMKYRKWFEGYKDVSRECLMYMHGFRMLDTGCMMDDVIRWIVEYNRVFLESLRYVNREEIEVLCRTYSEFEMYKEFLIEQESEIVFDSKLNISVDMPEIEGSKKDVLHYAVQRSLEDVSKFNSESFRMIMKLAANDANNILRILGRFVYNPSGTARNLIVEAGREMDDYRQCVSFSAVRRCFKEKIDEYVLEEVILKHRLDGEQYFELVDMIGRLKELFEDDEWKCEIGCKYVGDIFNGREIDEPLFRIINGLYENET